jgi:hypothetical protein
VLGHCAVERRVCYWTAVELVRVCLNEGSWNTGGGEEYMKRPQNAAHTI